MMSLITVVFKVDLHYVVDKLAAPLVKAGDSYFGVIIPVFLITFSGLSGYTEYQL